MSTHSDEFHLSPAIGESVRVCRVALRTAGWRITEDSDTRLVLNEITTPLMSMTWPVSVEMTFSVDPSGGTRVVVNGSIFGFGPIQSGHLRKAMQVVRTSVERATSRSASGVPGPTCRPLPAPLR